MTDTSWKKSAVSDCLSPLNIPSKAKLQTKDYKASGKYPIIDQGQEFISGWTDDSQAVITEGLPLIVFGDHTRALKYVDVPFVRGADGTQVLRPKPGINPLFFYYACRWLDIPGRGYNRHFSILKESEINIPDAETEQERIGETLRVADQLFVKQSAIVNQLQNVKSSAMHTLFSRGLRGEPQRDTEIGPVPEGWEVVRMGSLGKIGNGSTPKKSISAYWNDGVMPWLTSGVVHDREINDSAQMVSSKALKECHLPLVQPGAILIAITGQGKTLGNCAILHNEATVNQHIAYVQINKNQMLPGFLRGYLETQYQNLRQAGLGNGSTKGALTCGYLRDLPVPKAGLDEQAEIVAILDAIDQKIDLHKRKRAVLEELFKSLLHKLMTGEVRVRDLNLSALGIDSDPTQEGIS
ncbi:restriction endonuclease subunit S [Deinococcus sp. UR1]|uniref:restriction endonuclease subunit S n=1 Tax=Deinococcus sp. UR1 TaxID=1704277 RepID=UPI000C18B378|nr:restriction endonuclease subunit S [Deinococcus sp. UR1]PIG95924.1 restriction endonuclease [Deinococcus sp. UR1]